MSYVTVMRISRSWVVVVLAFAFACGGGKSKPTPGPANTAETKQDDSKAGQAKPKSATKFQFELIAGRNDGVMLEGTLRDATTKEPLMGATVVMTSPALQGEQVMISDERGQLMMKDLPPGEYVMTAYYNDQTVTGKVTIATGKIAKVSLAWDMKGAADSEVVVIDQAPEPKFNTAIEALKKGAMAQVIKLGEVELAKSPNARLHGMLALARYAFAIEVFRVDAFAGAGRSKTSADFRNAVVSFLSELDKVQDHLTAAAKDSKFSLELCVACMAAADGFYYVLGEGALDIERDRKGQDLPENDPRRRPTYRFDHGDLAWARAMVSYQQALANVTLAYDWSWIDKLMADDQVDDPNHLLKLTIKLTDPARIAKARELLLAGLVASDEARTEFLAETDDDREWVPSPKQKSYASPLTVDAALYKTWEDVVTDVRSLVAGDTGVSLKALWTVFGMRREAPAGFMDFGAMLKSPTDITFELGTFDRIENEKNPAKRGKLMTAALKGLLGNGFKTSMKPSRLTDRLIALRKQGADDLLEEKLKYVLWLN